MADKKPETTPSPKVEAPTTEAATSTSRQPESGEPARVDPLNRPDKSQVNTQTFRDA